MKLAKFDELDALIKGILFSETHSRTECYYWENASDIRYGFCCVFKYLS
jgi:type II pantothenate kinase